MESGWAEAEAINDHRFSENKEIKNLDKQKRVKHESGRMPFKGRQR